jgi:hypothetical protein
LRFLHENVAGISNDAGLPVRFARQPGIWIGGADVRLVAPFRIPTVRTAYPI